MQSIMSKTTHILLLCLCAVLLSACGLSGNTEDKTGTVTPSAENLSPTSTLTPTPTSTPEPEARIAQGDLALLQGNSDDAIQTYRSAALASSDAEIQAAALLGIAKANYEKGDYTTAINTLQSLIHEMPENKSLANGYYFLAASYDATQQYALAAEAYGKYIEYQPGVLDDLIYEYQGQAYFNAAMYPEAILSYQNALQATQDDPGSYLLEIGQAYNAAGDSSKAVEFFLQAYDQTNNDYTKATANLLAGRVYIQLGFNEQAFARFQDSVNNFWKSYDAYSGLVELVNSNQPVDELQRGLVDYYAGQYGYAAEAFSRYLTSTPDHDGTAHYFRGMALIAVDDANGAISEWQALIRDHPADTYYSEAFQEIAYTQWAYLEDFDSAAETLKNYVALNPGADDAADRLYDAARILERGDRLTPAAQLWESLIDQYPSAEASANGLFMSGITYYRLGNYEQAKNVFQRKFALGTSPEEQAAALFWVGKAQQALGDSTSATTSWSQASVLDSTGYYGIRANEMVNNLPLLHSPAVYDLGVDTVTEKIRAENWLKGTFALPDNTDFTGLAGLSDNAHFQRGMALWAIDHFQDGRNEFEAVREDIASDALVNYRFMNEMLSIGAYRPAIFSARQILTLANMDDNDTLSAPLYFNLVRFGAYFQPIVVAEANETGFNPLFILSVMRQESFFEPFAGSSAGARGLMQIMPATGADLASRYAWPQDYTDDDLYNAAVSLRLGIKYLATQRDYFGGDYYKALAAYNAGPGNAQIWGNISGDDPDLYLEIIRYDETRNYIRNIVEFMDLYRRVYERN
jgi:soluble lytic murein transglycosylase